MKCERPHTYWQIYSVWCARDDQQPISRRETQRWESPTAKKQTDRQTDTHTHTHTHTDGPTDRVEEGMREESQLQRDKESCSARVKRQKYWMSRKTCEINSVCESTSKLVSVNLLTSSAVCKIQRTADTTIEKEKIKTLMSFDMSLQTHVLHLQLKYLVSGGQTGTFQESQTFRNRQNKEKIHNRHEHTHTSYVPIWNQ